MEDNIYGLDLSSRKVAIVELTEDGEGADTFTVSKMAERHDELYSLWFDVMGHMGSLEPGWVYIESPVVGRGGAQPTILQAQVDSIIHIAAASYDHLGCYSVNNKTWKKTIVGNGNATKSDVTQWLRSNHPSLAQLAHGDQDLVDAACVALYGREVVQRAQRLG